MELINIIISIAYAISGIIGVLAYIPTVQDLRKGTPSANIQSYWMWFWCFIIACLYSGLVVKDMLFFVLMSSNLVFTIYILIKSYSIKRNVTRGTIS